MRGDDSPNRSHRWQSQYEAGGSPNQEALAVKHKECRELIIRIVHLIDTEYGLQTTFIKSLVMSHKR